MSSSVLDSIGLTAPMVNVAGTAIDPRWMANLVSLRVNSGLSMMGRATLRFIDPGYSLAAAGLFGLGDPVTVSIGKTTVFKGNVTGVSLEHTTSSIQELVVTVDDPMYKLNVSHGVITWEQQTVSAIVTKLSATTNLGLDCSAPTTTYDYILQQGSDLAFLEAITRRVNCVWFVDGDSLMVKTAGGAAAGEPVKVTLAQDMLDFSVRASALHPVEAKVPGWDSAQLQDIQSNAVVPDAVTDATFAADYVGTAPKNKVGAKEFVVNDTQPDSASEANVFATSLETTWQSQGVVARGTTYVNAAIKPYHKVKVDGAGPANGVYVVNEVEHVYSQRGFFTKFVAGPVRQTVLVDAFNAPQSDPGFARHGLVTAIVSEVGSESVSGATSNGLVRVKYSAVGTELVSAWARVVSPGAGKSRGSVFLPEVGDEVLVGFERGDTRHPVVLGGLFGAKTPMPGSDAAIESGKTKYRRLMSREGHFVELADGGGGANSYVKLQLSDASINFLLSLDKGEINLPSGKPFTIKIGSSSIEFSDSGDITIKGANVKINADQGLTLDAKMKLEGKGATGVSLSGATAELKGDGTATLQSSGQTAVKGTIVMIN